LLAEVPPATVDGMVDAAKNRVGDVVAFVNAIRQRLAAS